MVNTLESVSFNQLNLGYTKSKELKDIHLTIIKQLLNDKQSTSTDVIYVVLGRFLLHITRYVLIIQYWCKICNSDKIIIITMYKAVQDNWYKVCQKLGW